MCVGLSARVISIEDGAALIDASGAKRTVSAELIDDLEPGDYV
ncbi:MAG: HypC/HybG/HupF family hydrogenase formation chaperone, partial [Lentisphaeria bacterium]|nr:HypC/HybG/HupF family hydrogenase formation chaperone [Lentisphaeria bacterium]